MNKEKNRKSELSPSETNHSSNAPDETRRFSNYTQDTLTEVLSWYGLQESGVVTSMAGQGDGDVTSSVVSSCSPLVQCEAKSVDVPLDLTHCQLKTECDTHGLTDGSMLDTGGQHSQSHKKVGMRFIFPPLSDELTLLEKAQIWVARHNYKYFVNWTEEQLKSVDSILQPVVPVTPSLYKTHMNRSEYCRNVKLKFCLEADAAWSREFRERLQKPANEGGFSGLCQAKIAAAELWRRYSENYKSHQARYPNPKNKYRQKRIDRQISNPEHLTDVKALEEREAKDDIPYKRRRRSSEYDQGRPGLNGVEVDVDDAEDVDMDDAMCSQESCCKEEYRALIESGSGFGVPGDAQDKSADRVVETAMSASKHSPRPTAIPSPSLVNGKSCTPQKAASISPCGSEVDFHHGRVSSTPVSPEICNKITSSVNYDAMVSPPESASSAHNGIAMSDMYLNGSQKHQQLLQQQQPEYKRSERGLSYLFPSLNDHKLSLLDKVWITVVRHKNNYFLGWQEDTLATVDPLIRPKMVVTMELYREYCHRNAMKYDSNVQFCMESPEPWAREFREKLRRAPCQGGFGSLCEVKLEAGRLWREYSGKYRMHNIVKWHMDMNTMTTSTGTAADTDGQLEQQKADVLLSSVLQHQPGQRAEPPTLQVKTESPCQSASASPAEPAVDLPGLNAGLRVDLDLTKNAIDDERAAQLSRRTSSFDTGHVKGTVSPTVVRPGPSSRPASDTRHTPPSRPAETRSVDDCSATQLDSLFRPLPKNLSVFEQMCIWLERHHRNYFVGYTPAELAQLDDHLRPQMFVTKEVFEKNVSESMMDVLGKVETIMRCDDPWARAYQEKLRGFDGGFVSFEEALTQAVILWATRQPSSSQTGAKLYGKHDGVHNGSGSATETPTGTGSSSQHAVTRMSPSQLAGVIRTRPRYQTSNGDGSAIVATSVDSAREGQTNNYAIPENNTKPSCDRETPTVTLNSRMTPEETGCSRTKNVVADAHARHVSSPIDALWRCRDALRTACADDPCRSWQERLQPCLPILRHTLGADYRCPERLSDCMVDLFLATIHQRLVASEVGGQQADS